MEQSPQEPVSPDQPEPANGAAAARPDWANATQYQRKTDIEHLNLLAIFYFVMGGLALFGLLVQGAMFALMGTFMMNPQMSNQPGAIPAGGPPPEFIALMGSMLGCMALFSVAQCTLNVLSGLYLRKRTHRTVSMVAAGINCLNVPLGVALGVFTFIVLSRESVKRLYEEEALTDKPPVAHAG